MHEAMLKSVLFIIRIIQLISLVIGWELNSLKSLGKVLSHFN